MIYFNIRWVCFIVVIFVIYLLYNFTLEKFEGEENKSKVNYNNAYIINLDRNKDRLDVTSKLLRDYGFDVKRYNAVDGKGLSDVKLNKYVHPYAMKSIKDGYRNKHHELSYGGVGCYLSHLNLWKVLTDSDEKHMIIFEDDTFPMFTKESLKNTMKYVPDDWDIVLFGGIYNSNTQINDYVCKIHSQFYCLHAYIINKNKLQKLIESALPMDKQIDSFLSDLVKKKEINIYGITDNLWKQNHDIFTTTIQTPIKDL
jgi:GR25 family glycosyltransferase involved in LPS biosynthesis